jgi:mono/diheme cytochrome c family protein
MRFFTLLIAALAFGAPIVGPAHAADTEAQIDQGREIYGEFCVACHGRDLISNSPVTFDLRKFPKEDAPRFKDAVLNGKGQAMPPWRDKLSDEEVNLLWAYVRSGG